MADSAVTECESTHELPRPSSYHEFADIFSFLQHFGSELNLPSLSLSSLEQFFIRGDVSNIKDSVTSIHFTLVKKIRRTATHENWSYIAIKFAYSKGVVGVDSDYDDLTLHERVKLMQLLCEAQFERNYEFKNNIFKYADDYKWRDSPIGLDKLGCRYWLLQDNSHDIRLYTEDRYTEHPYAIPVWTLICSSEEELCKVIESLKKKQNAATSVSNNKKNSSEEDCSDETSQASTPPGKMKQRKRAKPVDVIGCMQCLKDTNHTKMLLCDGCDAECHMYCQYPVVWSVPKEDWFCPNCRQSQLITALEETYSSLLAAKETRQRDLELEHRRMKSLARGGMLLQNIIIDSTTERRSSRERKNVNYAELNEPHIPQLGRRDIIYYHQHRTRQSRLEEEEEERRKEEDRKKIEEAERMKREEEDKTCKLLVTTEYKGDSSDWKERRNDSPSYEENEGREDEVRKLVCRISIPRIKKPLCQQTELKPHISTEGRPSLEYPAHEALLPPPLPPLSPPPSTQEDRLSMTQTTLLSTCTRISELAPSFTSCSSGSLCCGLECNAEKSNSCQTDSAQTVHRHQITKGPSEDQSDPVNNTTNDDNTIF